MKHGSNTYSLSPAVRRFTSTALLAVAASMQRSAAADYPSTVLADQPLGYYRLQLAPT
jgi:hypothetical protein